MAEIGCPSIYRAPPYTVHFPFPPRSPVYGGFTVLGHFHMWLTGQKITFHVSYTDSSEWCQKKFLTELKYTDVCTILAEIIWIGWIPLDTQPDNDAWLTGQDKFIFLNLENVSPQSYPLITDYGFKWYWICIRNL